MYKWYLLLGVCAYIGLHSRRAFSVKASIMPITLGRAEFHASLPEMPRNFDELSVPETSGATGLERERAIFLFFNFTRRRRPREAKRRRKLNARRATVLKCTIHPVRF